MYIPLSQCVFLNGNKQFKHVVHIGAHHGEEGSQYVECGVESVVWLEASRRFMAELYDKTQGLKLKQFHFNACLSDTDGEKVKFHISNNGQSSSILELGTHATMYPHINYVAEEEIETQRFDSMARKYADIINVNKVDFINLDVQGAELKVLKGFGNLLALPNIKAIYTEVNFEHVYKDCCLIDELDSYLKDFGFVRTMTVAPEKTWGDALYIRFNT